MIGRLLLILLPWSNPEYGNHMKRDCRQIRSLFWSWDFASRSCEVRRIHHARWWVWNSTFWWGVRRSGSYRGLPMYELSDWHGKTVNTFWSSLDILPKSTSLRPDSEFFLFWFFLLTHPQSEHCKIWKILTEEDMRLREKTNIEMALKQTDWKIYGTGGAAELLDLKPTILLSRIKKMGIVKAY